LLIPPRAARGPTFSTRIFAQFAFAHAYSVFVAGDDSPTRVHNGQWLVRKLQLSTTSFAGAGGRRRSRCRMPARDWMASGPVTARRGRWFTIAAVAVRHGVPWQRACAADIECRNRTLRASHAALRATCRNMLSCGDPEQCRRVCLPGVYCTRPRSPIGVHVRHPGSSPGRRASSATRAQCYRRGGRASTRSAASGRGLSGARLRRRGSGVNAQRSERAGSERS
jgi:hypothetical protein